MPPKHALLSILFLIIMFFPVAVRAQLSNIGVAQTFRVGDTDAVAGDIVSLPASGEVLSRARSPYDERMFGVIVDTAAIIFRSKSGVPVMQTGTITVNATTQNGPIAVGDYVTASAFPGKAQKATDRKGYILGRALTGLKQDEGTPVSFEGKTLRLGKISVSVGIGPSTGFALPGGSGSSSSLFQAADKIASDFLVGFDSLKGQDRRVRYIMAGIVAVTIIFINFVTLGRNISHGIESIGRNPLARMSIQSMIVLNVVLITIISIGGIALSLAILSF